MTTQGDKVIVKKFFDDEDTRDDAKDEWTQIVAARIRCGDIVPRVLGLFGHPEPVLPTYLVMADCGKAPSTFSELSADDRYVLCCVAFGNWLAPDRVCRALIQGLFLKLHHAGFVHGDVRAANVVFEAATSTWRVVDFGNAVLRHVCGWDGHLCSEVRHIYARVQGEAKTA